MAVLGTAVAASSETRWWQEPTIVVALISGGFAFLTGVTTALINRSTQLRTAKPANPWSTAPTVVKVGRGTTLVLVVLAAVLGITGTVIYSRHSEPDQRDQAGSPPVELKDGVCPTTADENPDQISPLPHGTQLAVGTGTAEDGDRVEVQVCTDPSGLTYYFGNNGGSTILRRARRDGQFFRAGASPWMYTIECQEGVAIRLIAEVGAEQPPPVRLSGTCV